MPMSTEILESTFGLYKQLERQHSKGGFTSLLAGFGALLKTATDEGIRRTFSTVSVKDIHQLDSREPGHYPNLKTCRNIQRVPQRNKARHDNLGVSSGQAGGEGSGASRDTETKRNPRSNITGQFT